MSNKYLLFPFFGLIIPLVVYFSLTQLRESTLLELTQIGEVHESDLHTLPDSDVRKNSNEIIFVGDVLLARNVEQLMNTKGVEYPFKKLSKIFADAPHIIGNFESAILEHHRKTPSYVTTFSVDKRLIPVLQEVGFTHFSLANNHSFDYGAETFQHTKLSLSEVGLQHFGNPQEVSTSSVSTFLSGDYTVSIIGINKVYANPNWEDVKSQMELMSLTSDYQIAYVHWGEEYMLKHNQMQETYAKMLIDAGIDSVIGHHPHVTQDIQIYNGKPIFYSLGNFIFDQYFSVDVQQGLVLKLVLSSSTAEYTLAPISSEGSLSQPYLMNDDDATLFLKNLTRRSDSAQTENILKRKLIFQL